MRAKDGARQFIGMGPGRITGLSLASSPPGWREIPRFNFARRSALRARAAKFWTVPVVAHGRLYLREQEQLHCLDLRAP